MTFFDRLAKFPQYVVGSMLVLGLTGCMSLPDPALPIPTREIRSSGGTHERLVVVLPGRGDDLATLESSSIAQEIQQASPVTDVLFVEATMAYYMEGKLVERLHAEVVTPALARGYREIWFAGASMGGLGTLLYEHEHPGVLTGLVLMAPYMGSRSVQKEIRKAGGLAGWDPGPKPSMLTLENVTREEWRVVKSLLNDKRRALDVWLICGDDDRLREAAQIIATALPPDHSLQPVGGHRWTVWSPAAGEAFAKAIDQKQRASSLSDSR